ncbi:hypothetical protein QBC46DRAFT_268296 [Diplogelasinospora grovesii]|uniref:Uncharacterized protein n=1 Tax=Diplogelasinospora grovesii TaxID=303347 RepID=A0AAN6N2D2_9PEZI|nr:hypothetical protein QBC46DRAFT_268296 [Diplogelasinospora grovesii]
MGTRHLICVFWKGQWVLAQYGQWDGDAEFCGVKVYRFLSVAQNVEHLKAGLEHHVYCPTNAEIRSMWIEAEDWDEAKHKAMLIPLYVYLHPKFDGINVLYPSLSRGTSHKILSMIARAGRAGGWERSYPEGSELIQETKIPLQPELHFARYSFCEWVYVIDLDKEVLEVYGGHEWKDKIVGSHRFEDVRAGEDGSEKLLPALRGSYTFSELFLYKDNEEFLRKLAWR